jgi:hypothetical protein
MPNLVIAFSLTDEAAPILPQELFQPQGVIIRHSGGEAIRQVPDPIRQSRNKS